LSIRRCTRFALLPLLALAAGPGRLLATDAVVGDGTPASCTEAALDAAVASANSGNGTITFACGADPVTIALTSAKTITAVVTVDSDLLVTLSGGNATRHFVVAAGGYLALRDIALVQGQAPGGGAILAEATSEVHFFFTTITDNVSTTVGGAIAATGAVVQGNNSRVADNQAAGAGGAFHLTGGRLDLGLVLVHGNSAGGAGGAVSISNCNQLAVLLASFDQNVAGGGGGGLDVSNCSGFLEQTQIVMNTAGGNGGGMNLSNGSSVSLAYDTIGRNSAAEGGGMFLDAGTSSTQRQVTLSGNQAVAAGARGGAIANLGTLLLENATVSGNSAVGSGGGLHSEGSTTLRFVTIAWNQADVGGGLASSGATLLMRNVILAGDAATTSGAECEISTVGPDIASSLWQGTTCGASATNGNQPATDALLVPLDFSCPPGTSLELTRTHDLDPTSPARDTGVPLPGGNAFMDQRSVLRPQGLGTDIGAVEYSPSSCPWFFKDGFERGNTFAWSNVVD
jgi:predicted outer membrane repeat protein